MNREIVSNLKLTLASEFWDLNYDFKNIMNITGNKVNINNSRSKSKQNLNLLSIFFYKYDRHLQSCIFKESSC